MASHLRLLEIITRVKKTTQEKKIDQDPFDKWHETIRRYIADKHKQGHRFDQLEVP
jgi:hypothetical protein